MRWIETIPHEHCGIHIFHGNGKYILKIEWLDWEQVYKISDQTPNAVAFLKEKITVSFLNTCLQRFLTMKDDIFVVENF